MGERRPPGWELGARDEPFRCLSEAVWYVSISIVHPAGFEFDWGVILLNDDHFTVYNHSSLICSLFMEISSPIFLEKLNPKFRLVLLFLKQFNYIPVDNNNRLIQSSKFEQD